MAEDTESRDSQDFDLELIVEPDVDSQKDFDEEFEYDREIDFKSISRRGRLLFIPRGVSF